MLSWHQFFKSADDACLLHYSYELVDVTAHCGKGELTAKQMQVLRKLISALENVPVEQLRETIGRHAPLFIGSFVSPDHIDIARQIDDSGMISRFAFVAKEGFVPMDRRLGTQVLLENSVITQFMVEQMKMADVPCLELDWNSPQMNLIKTVKRRDDLLSEMARVAPPSAN
jgi:hypothetical protein